MRLIPEGFDPRQGMLCGEDPVMGPQEAPRAHPGLPHAPRDPRGRGPEPTGLADGSEGQWAANLSDEC